MAAQSFHWADPETRWSRLASLLAPKGLAALFWNGWQLDADTHDHDAVRRVYNRCGARLDADLDSQRRADPEWPQREITDAAELELAGVRTYRWRHDMTTKDYLGPLATTSQYIVAGDRERATLFAELQPVLGDRVVLLGKTLLVRARRAGGILTS